MQQFVISLFLLIVKSQDGDLIRPHLFLTINTLKIYKYLHRPQGCDELLNLYFYVI